MKLSSRKQAIKDKCFECSGYNKAEVRRCEIKHCPLWVYRLGREVKTEDTSQDPVLH